jgi:hypothetical protein
MVVDLCYEPLLILANVGRLHQECKYDPPQVSSSGPTPSPSPRPEVFPSAWLVTPGTLKNALIQKLEPLTPENMLSTYAREIEPWFPIVSIPMLSSLLAPTWEEITLDVAILSLSILLLTTHPPSSPDDNHDSSEFKSLYLCTKSILASTEGLGINSFSVVKSRILVTLFEVAHGLYPAAYISIGATVRAADALELHPVDGSSPPDFSEDGANREEQILTWCGILVLDR